LIGGGGSILAVPLLLYVVGITDPHVAIGTSALAVAANAFANLLGHWRAGNVKWVCAVNFALAGMVGAAMGSTVGKLIDGQQLLLFGAAGGYLNLATRCRYTTAASIARRSSVQEDRSCVVL